MFSTISKARRQSISADWKNIKEKAHLGFLKQKKKSGLYRISVKIATSSPFYTKRNIKQKNNVNQ